MIGIKITMFDVCTFLVEDDGDGKILLLKHGSNARGRRHLERRLAHG